MTSASSDQTLLRLALDAFEEGVFCIDRRGMLLFRSANLAPGLVDRDSEGRSYERAIRHGPALEFVHLSMGGRPDELHKAPDGLHVRIEERFFHIRMTRVTADDEAGGFYLFTVRDETEEKAAQRLRQEFLENSAHELRTPVTSIRGYAETLLHRTAKDPERGFVEAILRNAQRLERLISDMGTIASLESREYAFHPRQISLGAYLEDVRQMIAGQLARRRQTLSLSVAPALRLYADPLLLEHLLLNLIDNASRYAPENSTIQVRARAHERGVVLEVIDSGPGVPPEFRERVFERFFRLDANRPRAEGGSGLGLSIVRRIVRRHGGRIRVEDNPGGGALFRTYLPPAEGDL